jgi:hypothetical protein
MKHFNYLKLTFFNLIFLHFYLSLKIKSYFEKFYPFINSFLGFIEFFKIFAYLI